MGPPRASCDPADFFCISWAVSGTINRNLVIRNYFSLSRTWLTGNIWIFASPKFSWFFDIQCVYETCQSIFFHIYKDQNNICANYNWLRKKFTFLAKFLEEIDHFFLGQSCCQKKQFWTMCDNPKTPQLFNYWTSGLLPTEFETLSSAEPPTAWKKLNSELLWKELDSFLDRASHKLEISSTTESLQCVKFFNQLWEERRGILPICKLNLVQ